MNDYDIVVVGAGAAGTAAALSAAEAAKEFGNTLQIAILERTNETDWGGNSRYTTANLRMSALDKLYPTFEEDIMKDSQDKADREYVHRLALEAPDTIQWLATKGVKFSVRPEVNRLTFRVGPMGGGLEIITALRENAEKQGVDFITETTAYKLSQKDNQVVDGVYARTRDGRNMRLSCRATILAGGGFEGNREMLTKYIGRDAVYLRFDVPATKYHLGECINMALEIGAKPSGNFGSYHGAVVDTRSSAYRPKVDLYAHGILVNVRGERFTDEGIMPVTEAFEIISRSVFGQPEHKAHIILDQKSYKIPNFKGNLHCDLEPIKANSLEELADKIGVPAMSFVETVNKYNQAVQDGNYDPMRLDGKRTAGIFPAKSNWALKIDEPPFTSYPVEGTVQFTWGGIATDSKGRVLATNDSPIPGLYAAGEMVGLYYHHYTGATSVLRALTYGRIAGFEAVRSISEDESQTNG